MTSLRSSAGSLQRLGCSPWPATGNPWKRIGGKARFIKVLVERYTELRVNTLGELGSLLKGISGEVSVEVPLIAIVSACGVTEFVIPVQQAMLKPRQNVGPIIGAEGVLGGIPAKLYREVNGEPRTGRCEPLLNLKVELTPSNPTGGGVPRPEGFLDLGEANGIYKVTSTRSLGTRRLYRAMVPDRAKVPDRSSIVIYRSIARKAGKSRLAVHRVRVPVCGPE